MTVGFYVAAGHSREWADWWLAFCREFTGRMTKARERELFLK
ncbi:hypothetical protein RF074_26225 [Serratia marcescens]|nr:hypothetical protein [Serratia marcescens]MDQ9479071.1 hypothetical protein [Serratia marcescens]